MIIDPGRFTPDDLPPPPPPPPNGTRRDGGGAGLGLLGVALLVFVVGWFVITVWAGFAGLNP